MVQFYANGEQVEAFPCGPRKIELLREKLEKWKNWCHIREFEVKHPLPDTTQNDAAAAEVFPERRKCSVIL